MMDTRDKNKYPNAKSVSEYLKAYGNILSNALSHISESITENILDELNQCIDRQRRIYVGGNGGSSAIASHLCCDWMKGTHIVGQTPLKVHSLTENSSLVTALANDLGYEHSLSEQIKYLGDEGDLLVLISSSGNSPNILRAVEAARAKKMRIISFTGFTGGKLASISDVNLHVPIENYGVVEDCHQMLMHVFSQYLYLQRNAMAEGTQRVNPKPTHLIDEISHPPRTNLL